MILVILFSCEAVTEPLQRLFEQGDLNLLSRLHAAAIESVAKTIVFYFLFCRFFFRNKLVSEDKIKIKIKFIWTIFQLNYVPPTEGGGGTYCF